MSEAFDELQRRCKEAGLRFHAEEGAELYITYPRGRKDDEILLDNDDASILMLLREPFEKYKGIEGYIASWSPKDGIIECNVHRTDPRLLPHDIFYARSGLQQLGLIERNEPVDPNDRFEFNSSTGLSISIGPCSNIHGILHYYSDFLDPDMDIDEHRPLTLQIRGADVQRHDDALELLRRVGDATLFNIDLSLGLPLTLERAGIYKSTKRSSAGDADSIAPIRYEYDREPMSLYWYAKTASEMPLLEFLAYYQVLEFYFPFYSQLEAKRTLQNTLKDPAFDPTRDGDLVRLLEALKIDSKGRVSGNEAEQLEAAIRHSVTAEDLRTFLLPANEDRYKFYTSDDSRKLVRETIPIRKESDDHRGAVAKRIYAIRNRIVHTKSGYAEREPLFPFDPETKYLQHDSELVEFLARKVLIASSRPLRV